MDSKLKITFIGACNAGKTSIINRIINDNDDILPSKTTKNTSIFLNIENKNSNISTLLVPGEKNYYGTYIDIKNNLTILNNKKRKGGDFNEYNLKTNFTNIINVLADELIIQDVPGLSEDFLNNNDNSYKLKFFSDKIFSSAIIYYVFNFIKVEEELKYFKETLKYIKELNPICIYEGYFKIIINQIDKINDLINDDPNITEEKRKKYINKEILETFNEIIGMEYNYDIIYISSLKKDHNNYKKYGKSFNLLIKNIEDDLLNHNKIDDNFIKKTINKVKNEIILDFNEQRLDILVKERVKEIMDKLMKEINENKIEEKKQSEIKLSEKEIETNKNFLILNLIFADDKLNKYPINIVFEKYKKYFVISRAYRLLYLLAPINLIGLPFGILFGLIGGIGDGIYGRSIKSFGRTFVEIFAGLSFTSSWNAYEIGEEKDKFERFIDNGYINKSNSQLGGSAMTYVNLNELINKKEEYIYLYNSYDDKFNYKMKASFKKSTNDFYVFPPVGNKVYNSIYKFGNYINEKII